MLEIFVLLVFFPHWTSLHLLPLIIAPFDLWPILILQWEAYLVSVNGQLPTPVREDCRRGRYLLCSDGMHLLLLHRVLLIQLLLPTRVRNRSCWKDSDI